MSQIESIKMNGNDVINVFNQSQKIIKKMKIPLNLFSYNLIPIDMLNIVVLIMMIT